MEKIDLDDIKINFNSRTTVNESSLSRLYKHYTEYDSGTISAFRSENTYNENMERTRKLKMFLLTQGYSVTKIDGVYDETVDGKKKIVSEISFIVIDVNNSNNLKDTLIKAGTKFNQESITFSKANGEYYLIDCKTKKETKLSEPMFGKDGNIKSKVNGRPFIFGSLTENEDHSINDVLEDYSPLIARYTIKKDYSILDNINL